MPIRPGGLLTLGVEDVVVIDEPFLFGGAVSVDSVEPFNFGDVHNMSADMVEPFDFGTNMVKNVVEPFDFGANISKSIVEPFDFGASGGARGGAGIDASTGQPLAPLMGYRDR